jgi:hypothetical protein
MSVLERRTQILFTLEQYDALQALASDLNQSVGSIVREAVNTRLAQRNNDRRAALTRLLASAEANDRGQAPSLEEMKESFERDYLERI